MPVWSVEVLFGIVHFSLEAAKDVTSLLYLPSLVLFTGQAGLALGLLSLAFITLPSLLVGNMWGLGPYFVIQLAGLSFVWEAWLNPEDYEFSGGTIFQLVVLFQFVFPIYRDAENGELNSVLVVMSWMLISTLFTIYLVVIANFYPVTQPVA